MSKQLIIFILFLLPMAGIQHADAQCSICTRTAQQMGARPASALNKGIIYLAVTPLAIFAVLGYRWWRSESHEEDRDA